MPPDKLPDELPWKWRQVATPITLSAAAFAQLVLEENLDTKKAGGYEWAARKTQDGHDLYQTLDLSFNWDVIPVQVGTTAVPAGGAQIAAMTVPAGKRWVVTMVSAQVVATGVANRAFSLYIGTAAFDYYNTSAGLTITDGQTKRQTMVANSLVTTAGTQFGLHFPLIELPATSKLTMYLSNIQAGDACTAATYYYKEAPA